MKLCAVTQKRGYGDRHAARKAAKHVHGRLRVYRCPYCQLIHITTQTVETGMTTNHQEGLTTRGNHD